MNAGLVLSALVLLIFGACYGGVGKAPDGVEFTYYDPAAFSVSVAGSFNNWDVNATPLVKDEEGTWRVVVQLEPGDYEYKFLVDGEWKEDPQNDQSRPNGFGSYNNVVNLSAP